MKTCSFGNKFTMHSKTKIKDDSVVTENGNRYKKHIILADANIPYKLSIDRRRNNLFFCINADEFSDQSFHSVVLDLDTGLTSIIPGIRNGFASTVDPLGSVYLGGSDGIFQFNYDNQDIDNPGFLRGVDIFDMYFHKCLYFVETANQNLYQWKDSKKSIVNEVKNCYIHHFVINNYDDILFVSSTGVYMLPKGAASPIMFEGVSRDINFRGAAADVNGVPHLIAHDGIYSIDMKHQQLVRILPVENGYGLAFDKDNNIIYSDERSVTKLIRQIGPY